jgi:hypothetical protein
MLYGVWTLGNGVRQKGKLECIPAQSRPALDEELGRRDLASSDVQFEATTEAEYAQKKEKWCRRTSADSYSGSHELPH